MWPWRLLSSAISYQRSSPEAQAGSARRRSTCSAAAAVEEARVQLRALYTPQRPVYTLFLPTAASAAVLRGCCRSLSGSHGRLNWFVGKTRSYLCHRDTEFSAPQGLSLCEVCRERQPLRDSWRAQGGKGGMATQVQHFSQLYCSTKTRDAFKRCFPNEILSIGWYCYLPFYLKSYGVFSPGGEQGSRWWVRIAFWP